jgi:subtilisin-like proprotein convertase family protein
LYDGLLDVCNTCACCYHNFSKTTVKLNAISGGTSKTSNVTSGSVSGSNPSITKVELYCNVASGTDPYTIYVKSPSGTTKSISGPTKSGTITITGFEGENPSGTWSIWIQNNGVSYNGNIYPVSTVTITLKVAYSY